MTNLQHLTYTTYEYNLASTHLSYLVSNWHIWLNMETPFRASPAHPANILDRKRYFRYYKRTIIFRNFLFIFYP